MQVRLLRCTITIFLLYIRSVFLASNDAPHLFYHSVALASLQFCTGMLWMQNNGRIIPQCQWLRFGQYRILIGWDIHILINRRFGHLRYKLLAKRYHLMSISTWYYSQQTNVYGSWSLSYVLLRLAQIVCVAI